MKRSIADSRDAGAVRRRAGGLEHRPYGDHLLWALLDMLPGGASGDDGSILRPAAPPAPADCGRFDEYVGSEFAGFSMRLSHWNADMSRQAHVLCLAETAPADTLIPAQVLGAEAPRHAQPSRADTRRCTTARIAVRSARAPTSASRTALCPPSRASFGPECVVNTKPPSAHSETQRAHEFIPRSVKCHAKCRRSDDRAPCTRRQNGAGAAPQRGRAAARGAPPARRARKVPARACFACCSARRADRADRARV